MKSKKKINIPIDEYINLSLYDKKNGYYMKKIPLEKRGISLQHQIFQDYSQK